VDAAIDRALPPRLERWPRRPDPAKGLLETIAVRDGAPIDFDRHLARLAASAKALYDFELPALELPGIAEGRLRIVVTPGGVRVEAEAEPPAEAPEPLILEPRAIAGGLGAHKWLDRPHEPHHLAVDLDGTVLEAGFANVWVLDPDGTLRTPPADGRILPGITRARLLAAPGVPTREAPVGLDDLARAEAVILTSSIRLATPAGLHPAGPTAAAEEIAARLRVYPAISRNPGSYIR
jgi:para-aminobenzoate synthetase/4-amino-4-deoxychorismate lyase